MWLPYMILPIYAGLERLPDSLLEASADLGAGAWRTFRSVVLPLAFPAIVAGSIFTFALSLGDYITVKIVGGSTQMAANVIYDNIGVAGNLPFAAAAADPPRREKWIAAMVRAGHPFGLARAVAAMPPGTELDPDQLSEFARFTDA